MFEVDNWDINSKGKIVFDEYWVGNWFLIQIILKSVYLILIGN